MATRVWRSLLSAPYADPLKDPKPATFIMAPITRFGKLRDYCEVPCFGSFGGSGYACLIEMPVTLHVGACCEMIPLLHART